MRHYVVFEGRNRGVYYSWKRCKQQVDGFKGASCKKYATLNEARQAFADYTPLCEIPHPTVGICSDASYSSATRVMQFRVVDIETRTVLHNSIEYQNCGYAANIGEFLGLVMAIKYALDHKLETPVYSDSALAIRWIGEKDVNAKSLCIADSDNRQFVPLIEDTLSYLRALPTLPPVQKWHTRLWGDIPADYGRKRKKKKTCNV